MEACLAVFSNFPIRTSNFILRSRADGDPTGYYAIPASQSAASVTAVFSSYLTDRPATKSASCSGQCSQLELTSGGDRRYRFVGGHTFAACLTRCVTGTYRRTNRPRVRFEAGNFVRSARRCGGDRCYLFVGCINVAACSTRWHYPIRNAESRV